MDDLYFEVFESLPNLVCILNPEDGRIDECNTKFATMSGLTKEEIRSMRFVDMLLKESDRAYVDQVFRGSFCTGHVLDEMDFRCVGGK